MNSKNNNFQGAWFKCADFDFWQAKSAKKTIALTTIMSVVAEVMLMVLFCQAFASEKQYQVILPVFIEDASSFDVTSLIGSADKAENTNINFDSKVLLEQFTSWLEPSILTRLQSLAFAQEGRQWISMATLNQVGLTAVFSEAKLEVHIAIPVSLRKSSAVSIFGNQGSYYQDKSVVEQSMFSSYLNINGGQNLRYGSADLYNEQQGFTLTLDGALNYRKWVLEGSGDYDQVSAAKWQRGDFRLVRDNPDSTLRYSIGDLNYSVSGFQAYRPLGGIAVTTQFGLKPYLLTVPISTHELLLKTPSMVKVWINGRMIQTLSLPSGKHDLRDFPLSTGTNDVMLEITDNVGRTEIVYFSYIYSDLLLAAGIHQVTYALGVPIQYDGTERIYQGSDTTAILSHRYGISDQLTIGGYAQFDHIQGLLGVSATTATDIGTFNLELAGSQVNETNQQGSALRFTYIYTDYKYTGYQNTGPLINSFTNQQRSSFGSRNLGLSLEAKSPRFAVLGNPNPDASINGYNLGASFSQQLESIATLNLTANYQINRANEASNVRMVSIGLTRNWNTDLDSALTFTHSGDPKSGFNNSLFLLLTWRFSQKNQTITTMGNTDNNAARIEWAYNSTTFHQAGGYDTAIGLSRSDGQEDIDGRFNYTGNHGRLGLTHASTVTRQSHDVGASTVENRTALTAGTSIVFADGYFGSTRPVMDSFAIIKGEKALQHETILINPQDLSRDENAFEGKTDWLGPAIMPELTSYRFYQLHLVTPNTPIGISLPREDFLLLPSYKSGSLIRVSTEAFVFAQGLLVNLKGESITLTSGEIRSISSPASPSVMIFTDRDGRFSAEGLKPGEYKLSLHDDPGAWTTFKVRENVQGFFELGTLQLQRKN